MKVYISADMEGISGVSAWEDVNSRKATYERYRQQMVKETRAAVNGALKAGATEILIKDAHATGRNLFFEDLPKEASLISGWSGSPYSMIQDITSEFDALVCIGYHAPSGNSANPLSHTMSSRKIFEVKVNGNVFSEFDLHALLAAELKVPVRFISGDHMICRHAKEMISSVEDYAPVKGVGNSMISCSPSLALERITSGVESALKEKKGGLYPLSARYTMSVTFIDAQDAYKASFYPGATQTSDRITEFTCENFVDAMTFLKFNL